MKLLFKKFFALALSLVMTFILISCGSQSTDTPTESASDSPQSQSPETSSSGSSLAVQMRSSVKMTSSDDGSLAIERPSRENTAAMGEEGTWTIFVYLCGADLESSDGMGTNDMNEMMAASTGENVRFVVQTGGAKSWKSSVSADSLQRYVICGGNSELVGELESASMGDSQTLTDFLSWGVSNYGAANMGLIFWDHGGGSISGVCFDEKYDNDSLSLKEIDAALLSVYDQMTDNFEFIGFDACLMGTVECANILASYSDYMFASQELEPGEGWDYTAIGDFLGQNPSADGAELGTSMAESYYAICEREGEGSIATMAVTDLSKIDAVLSSFNSFAQALYNATEDTDVLASVVRGVLNADNFGGNNRSEGYTNMVDLSGLAAAASGYAEGAEDVAAAISDAIIYKKNGSNHPDACGLSVYYPLQIQGSNELESFGQIAVSSYYLSFVDRAAYSAVNDGDSASYDDTGVTESWGDFSYMMNSSGYLEDVYDYFDNSADDEYYDEYYEEYYDDYYFDDDYWDYYDDYDNTGESQWISFASEPSFDDDGYFSFTLTQDSLNYVASVQAMVYELSGDGAYLIELGLIADVYADWDSGYFSDNFSGDWFSLPDGQNLAAYLVSECDGYDIYTCPVYLNGEETNIRITHDYTNDVISIDGIWSGIDENGMAGRDTVKLTEGDVIVPIYYAYAVESGEEYYYTGYEYTYDGSAALYYDYLPDGVFYYSFYIEDIYGNYYYSESVEFTIEGDSIYYSEF